MKQEVHLAAYMTRKCGHKMLKACGEADGAGPILIRSTLLFLAQKYTQRNGQSFSRLNYSLHPAAVSHI